MAAITRPRRSRLLKIKRESGPGVREIDKRHYPVMVICENFPTPARPPLRQAFDIFSHSSPPAVFDCSSELPNSGYPDSMGVARPG